MSNREKAERRARQIQEFRYGVIAELTNVYLARGELNRLIKEKAGREYEIPHSQRTTITEACIRDWLKRYRKYGKEGLLPKKRSDTGSCRSMSAEEISELLSYLEAHPELTATASLEILRQQGKITSQPSSSSLSRLVTSNGLDRASRMETHGDKQKSLKFAFFYPLECVQADDMHSIKVSDGKGGKRRAILMSFIDDATRRILYANCSFTERSVQFEFGIKHILRAHGLIGMIYVDHGSPFVSGQTKRILSMLGIVLVHSTVRRPQGRGKKERWYRTMRERFERRLDSSSITGLGDLNARLRSWIESEYHRTPHRGLDGKTPLDAWLEKSRYIKHVDPGIDLERAFMHEQHRKVYKDCTLSLDGTLYETSPALIGKRVTVLYDPHRPVKYLEVLYEGKSHGEARIVDTYANAKVKRNVTSRGSLGIDHEPEEPPTADVPVNPQGPKTPTQSAFAASRIDLSSDQGASQ